jgi:hypothetical protein
MIHTPDGTRGKACVAMKDKPFTDRQGVRGFHKSGRVRIGYLLG